MLRAKSQIGSGFSILQMQDRMSPFLCSVDNAMLQDRMRDHELSLSERNIHTVRNLRLI